MPWFMRKDADHVQEIVAVEIKQDGESIGWVHPDVAAALVAGTMSPEQVAEIARQQPEQPAGTERVPAGPAWQQDEPPQGERLPWWQFDRK